MQNISKLETLESLKQQEAVFILFGGKHCSVCQALKPKLDDVLEKRFPLLKSIYIDCQESPDICAQYSVFSLPAVKVYIDAKLITEDAKSFALNDLMQRIQRSYSLFFD